MLPKGDCVASSSDRDQSSKDSIAEPTHIKSLGRAHKGSQPEHNQSSHTGSKSCVHSNYSSRMGGGGIVHGEGTARIEAIPSKPQEECANHTERDIVSFEAIWINCVSTFSKSSFASTNQDRSTQSRHTTHHVHNS